MIDKLPDWLTDNDDGTMTIRYEKRAPKIDGTEVKELVLREPTVADEMASQKASTLDAEQEVVLFSGLLEVSPEAVRGMTIFQYKRVSLAYALFTS